MMNKHTVEAGYIRGEFWIPLDGLGFVAVYKGPPMDLDEAAAACVEHGDTGYWQLHNG
jgi:hypothetical protein